MLKNMNGIFWHCLIVEHKLALLPLAKVLVQVIERKISCIFLDATSLFAFV